MAKPRFSVIIPTLNEEKFLPKLLTSLAGQTVKNFDVVVVDGQSADRTVQVARRFRSKLPLTIILSEKRGVSRQRNKGATMGKADWLVFVDADSILFPHFMERIGEYIGEKHARFFTTWFKTDRDDPGEAIAGFLLNMGIEAGILIDRPWAPGPLTVVRRDVFNLVGGYNERVTFGEDHELGVTIFRRGVRFHILREILYVHSFRRYRKEGNLKVFSRGLKASLSAILTNRGISYIPGYVGGGGIYTQSARKKKKMLLLAKLEASARNFIEEFVSH